jgi:squalene-associated FAD-dependent desaturase
MSERTNPDVLIVGAGVAGLAAAVALSGAGASVSLLERKPYVGGRAYSYAHPALGEIIDSQHVLLGCCTNLIDLCKLAGADRHIRWYDRITFLEAGISNKPAQRSDIVAGILPAPGHSAVSFLRAATLSVADKSRIAIGLMDFLRGYPEDDHEPFSAWLKRTKQTDRSIRRFWEPVVAGALNDSFDRCSTRYAGQVFHESFLKSAEGGRLGIPARPLSEFYADVAELAEQQGTALSLRTSVDRVERLADGTWQATASDGSVRNAANLILALPFEQTVRLLGTLPEDSPQRQRILPLMDHFTHAPITTVHLWFDRHITDIEHAALLDTRIQWMFNKSRIRRFEAGTIEKPDQYIELVISASFAELHQSREEILAASIEEFSRFFATAREAKIVRSGVLKEARATFSVVPGLDRFRPAADAAGDNLYLAGDWTLTGWPSTMEGAVRSGRLAAEAIAGAAGAPARFVTPDLATTGLMRLLGR